MDLNAKWFKDTSGFINGLSIIFKSSQIALYQQNLDIIFSSLSNLNTELLQAIEKNEVFIMQLNSILEVHGAALNSTQIKKLNSLIKEASRIQANLKMLSAVEIL